MLQGDLSNKPLALAAGLAALAGVAYLVTKKKRTPPPFSFTLESERILTPMSGKTNWEGGALSGFESDMAANGNVAHLLFDSHVDYELLCTAVSLALDEFPMFGSRLEPHSTVPGKFSFSSKLFGVAMIKGYVFF
jgi:hypothetical protein